MVLILYLKKHFHTLDKNSFLECDPAIHFLTLSHLTGIGDDVNALNLQ